MIIFFTVVQVIIGLSLIAVILMQKSEGGGLGVGGSPAGLMSARGAADFLTRATSVLATIFVVLSIVLAALAAAQGSGRGIDTSLQRGGDPVNAPAAAPVDPLAPAALPGATVPAPSASGSAPADPLAPAQK
ncbi:preprotein translocase subunit SecG [Parablastomonas sp. CN1-191]|uniref:preprotein translocase subunit SecG n=1 Tax=Parablastomonas sp. CN1-191 TaxID=3400908 RepID=UPI003BF8F92D